MKEAVVVAALLAGCVSKPGRPPATGVARSWHHRSDPVAPGQAAPTFEKAPRLVYDPHRMRVLMYGGHSVDGGWNNQMWELDPARGWVLLCDACLPDPEGGHYQPALVYDPDHDQIVMYGGSTASSFDTDTVWHLKGDTWELAPTTGDAPDGRTQAQMVYDPTLHALWMLGGYGMGSPQYGTYLLDGDTWTKLEAPYYPGSMTLHVIMASPGVASTYDPERRRVLVRDGGNYNADGLWAYDDDTNAWSEVCDPCTGTARRADSIVHIPDYDQTFLIGGAVFDSAGIPAPIGGTMVLVGNEFKPVSDLPPPRYAAGVAYDPERDVVVLYGGIGDGTTDEDCNSLNECGGTWELRRD